MSTPVSAVSPDDGTGPLLWRVTLTWQRAMRATLEPHDLTHVQFVLLSSAWWLGEHEESPTQQRIADHAGTDAMMTGQVLRRLAARQLVTRELDEKDANARRIVLTETGRSVLAEALADVAVTEGGFFAALGRDAAVFRRGLTALRDDHRV
ncbi:MAG TPA: MarR family winged helix-turn-helix transcriptional regulator [Pseudonocardiaceae bacterium]|jgi:DNA-binding MarR family transcriptional regulator|nr:MarR family winged helix-turn-helix transcriptional regulator [Pseudonocardiaceae bacterium]